MRSRTLLVIVVLAALLAGVGAQPFSRNLIPTVQNGHAANRGILLIGFTTGWNASTNKNPIITVSQGDVIALTLQSGDGATHQFLLDGDNDGAADIADCPSVDPCSTPFSTSTTYTFAIDIAPGTYTYFCNIHPTTMLGTFIVKPAFTAGGQGLAPNTIEVLTPYMIFAAFLAALIGTTFYIVRFRHGRETIAPTTPQF